MNKKAGRPSLGAKVCLWKMRIPGETIERIKQKQKNVSAFVRGAIDEKLRK
jgi:post-segregation antitoxin (ccd killing protein)